MPSSASGMLAPGAAPMRMLPPALPLAPTAATLPIVPPGAAMPHKVDEAEGIDIDAVTKHMLARRNMTDDDDTTAVVGAAAGDGTIVVVGTIAGVGAPSKTKNKRLTGKQAPHSKSVVSKVAAVTPSKKKVQIFFAPSSKTVSWPSPPKLT